MTRTRASSNVELSGMLDRLDRLAELAERTDLLERSAVTRSWLGGRPLRVAVTGTRSAGVDGLVRALHGVASAWLPGASFSDASGGPGRTPGDGADVVLFATEAGREYGRVELDAIARIRNRQLPVLGVRTSFDTCADWVAIQQADRQRLQAAGLDTPVIPLLPVSAAMCETGRTRGDDGTVVASGVPQLLEYLRDRVETGVDARLRDAVLGEVRVVVDQLRPGWTDELNRLHADGGSPEQRQKQAVAELERRQRRSTNWQIALNDGVTELTAHVALDLRERLREVLEHADEKIGKGDPFADWAGFDGALHDRIDAAVKADYQVLRERTTKLARTVAGELAGTTDGSTGGIALPRIPVAEPDDALRKMTPMEPPEGGGSMLSRVVNSVRGSYGGILMVGVLTSLAGQSLISVYSVGAGILLGIFTFFEDRKSTRDRRKAEARAATAKLLDAANFRLGDHQRAQLRAVHRALRDHFTVINDDRLRSAAEAVRSAGEAHGDNSRRERVVELEARLAELRDLRGPSDTREPRRLASAR